MFCRVHFVFSFQLFFSSTDTFRFTELESSRTHFEVLEGQPWKLTCPRLEDSTIFWIVKILWSAWKIIWKTFFCGDRLKNFCEDLFSLKSTCACVLGPWPRAFLSLASRVSVLGKAVLGLGLGFFLCPWPQALCPRLHLWLLPLKLQKIDSAIRAFNKFTVLRGGTFEFS